MSKDARPLWPPHVIIELPAAHVCRIGDRDEPPYYLTQERLNREFVEHHYRYPTAGWRYFRPVTGNL